MFDKERDYWFYVEPYVFISFENHRVMLYNTLDGNVIISENIAIIRILMQISDKENCGVVLLTGRNLDAHFQKFFVELREKFMGNMFDIALSSRKPIQLMPILNLQYSVHRLKLTGYHHDTVGNILSYLNEVKIFSNSTLPDFHALIVKFVDLLPENIKIYLVDVFDYPNYERLLKMMHGTQEIIVFNGYYFFDNIHIKYLINNQLMNIRLVICFPVNELEFKKSYTLLVKMKFTVDVLFKITSNEDYTHAERLINLCDIDIYSFEPYYDGANLAFFKENVFLSTEDILVNPLSMKEIFAHQCLNTFDFGKLAIMPNGDVYANTNFVSLGNIKTHTVHEIIYKELTDGHSWLRIRNQAPCNDCIYQWLCPSPSDYEIVIGKPNLCHIKP